MSQLTPDDKKRIYDVLAKAYIEIVVSGRIGKVERKVLAQKIIDAVSVAKDYWEVHDFIQKLMAIYPVFKDASVMIDEPIQKLHEEQVIGRLQQFIHSSI